MANMNMIIHDMEGQIEIGTFKNPNRILKAALLQGLLTSRKRVIELLAEEGAS